MNAPHPYAAVARRLVDNGWSPVPLPPGKKAAPPGGRTGRAALAVTRDDADDFIARGMPVGARRFPIGNVALAMPSDVIGIDVDSYDGKRGADTMRAMTAKLGRLPRTVVSSRRFETHSSSGIRFFRIPAGVECVGTLADADGETADVEIIQRHHRYAVTAPSVVDGEVYRIKDQRTGEWLEVMPPKDDLPELPAAWLEHLRVSLQRAVTAPGAAPVALPAGNQSHLVQQRKAELLAEIVKGSRHDAVTRGVMGLVRLGERGETGVASALEEARRAFVKAVVADGSRTPAQAHAEFDRMVPGARKKVAETPTPDVTFSPEPEPTFQPNRRLNPEWDALPLRDRMAALAATAPAPILWDAPAADAVAPDEVAVAVSSSDSGGPVSGVDSSHTASAPETFPFENPNPPHSEPWPFDDPGAVLDEPEPPPTPAEPADPDPQPEVETPAPVESVVESPVEVDYVPSWQPVDVELLLDDDYEGPKTELWPIDNGRHLLYRGAVHQVFGQPEVWKSWLSLWALACVLREGGRCLLVDAEDRAVAAVARLRALGVTKADIRRGLDTVEPSANPLSEQEVDAFRRLVATGYDLVVIDSVTRTGALSGIKSNDQDSMTFWFGAVPSAFARRGAAVIVVDHVPKPSKDSAEGADRYAGGSNAKLGIVQVSFRVAVTDAPAPRKGQVGSVQMTCTKDRHGDIKEHAERFDVTVDSTGDVIGVSIKPVASSVPVTSEDRLVNARAAIMRALLFHAAGLGSTALRSEARSYSLGAPVGTNVTIDNALIALERDGIVERTRVGKSMVSSLTESWKEKCRLAGIPVPDLAPPDPVFDPESILAEPVAVG